MQNNKHSSFFQNAGFSAESAQSIFPNLLSQLQQFVNTVTNDSRYKNTTIVVGLSGGLDSSVLLSVLHNLLNLNVNIESQQQHEFKLKAVHVNHGISPNATDWVKHCQRFCERLGVDISVENITVVNTQRKGVEAVARNKRYSAFKNVMLQLRQEEQNVILVTGHHLRDQAETVLHNLTRGAGVNGLAAMPICKPMIVDGGVKASLKHCRPMLKVNYAELVGYAKVCNLPFVLDESNDDISLKRNLIRHDVLPFLQNYWPNIQGSLAKTAENMQDALVLLDELAEEQFSQLINANAHYLEVNLSDSSAHQKNLIRYWLKQYHADIVLSAKHYEWIISALAEVNSSKNSDHSYKLKNAMIKVYKNRVYILKVMPKPFLFNFESMTYLQGFIDDRAKAKKISLGQNDKSYLFQFNELDRESNVDLMSYCQLSCDLKCSINKKRIKRFFQSESIPSWERETWPVLVLNDKVVFLGCPKCSTYLLSENTANISVPFDLLRGRVIDKK